MPGAGGFAIVSNGGTAQLAGAGSTPVLGGLSIGVASDGLGVGTVLSNGVAIQSNAFSVGVASGLGVSFAAQGTLGIIGVASSGTTNFIGVGNIFGTTAAGSASGVMSVGGDLLLNNGGMHVGEIFDGGGGSVAEGTLSIGGNAGSALFLVAGSVFPVNPATQTGSQASGQISIGGNLTMAPGSFSSIGVSSGPKVGALFNQASGNVSIGGTLGFAGETSFMQVGTTEAGIALGALSVGNLNMGAQRIGSLNIGTTTAGGLATGSFAAGSGDLRVGALQVGTAFGNNGGSASGMLSLGGALQCVSGSCGGLSVGTAGGSGVVDAVGDVGTAGISGFSSYSIGTLSGASLAAGSSAHGRVVAGAGGVSAPSGTAFLGVGSAFGSGAGSQAGSSATGMLTSGGNISGFQFVSIGEAFLSAASTTGAVELSAGTLSASQFLTVGSAFGSGAGGIADGTLRLSNAQVLMTPGPGASFARFGGADGGQATGRLIATDSDVTLGSLSVGLNSGAGGSAMGVIDLERSTLRAADVFAGAGASANAAFGLVESLMQVDGAFAMGQGLLSLDNSFLNVGGSLGFADTTLLSIDIDGLLRGSQYGAIDAALASLDGVLSLSFEDLLGLSDVMIFDLIRSGSADGISGDFDSVSFSGLPVGYFLTAGVVFDSVEIYRVQLARVPEPGTLLLLLGALAGLAASRRALR